MNNGITVKDIQSSIKENKKEIILMVFTFVVIITTIVGFKEVSDYTELNENQTLEEIKNKDEEFKELLLSDKEDMTSGEQKILENILIENSYYFKIYIENPDGTAFGRSGLLREMLQNESTLKLAENELDYIHLVNPENLITVDYNNDSKIFSIISSAANKRDSKYLADTLYSIFTDKKIDLFKERTVYILEEPTFFKQKENEEDSAIQEIKPSKKSVATSVLLAGIYSTILGSLAATIIVLIKNMNKKNINYLYDYRIEKNESIIAINSKDEKMEYQLNYLLENKLQNKEIILIEKDINVNEENISIEKRIYNNYYQLDTKRNLEKAVLIVVVGKTSKQWFDEQSRYLKWYGIPRKIIRIL